MSYASLKENCGEPNGPLIHGRLRPMERVLEFLLGASQHSARRRGGRLPTNRELSEALKVSIPTVNSAIGKLVELGKVRTKRGSGKYFVPEGNESIRTVAVSLPMQGGQFQDEWANVIGAGMFSAMLRARIPIALVGASPSAQGGSDVGRLLEMREEVSGLILFPFNIQYDRRQELVDAYEDSGKPVVFVNPDRIFGGANFASFDYYDAGYRLGNVWRRSGRRFIVLMGGYLLKNSVSFQLWHSGLCCGLGGGFNGKTRLMVKEGVLHREESGYETMREILKNSKRAPDAVLSISDRSAMGAARALQEAGLEIPHDVSIVGATGLDIRDSAYPNLTRMRPSFDALGAALIEVVTQRIALRGARVPGVVVPTPFFAGDTTTVQENEILDSPTSPDPSHHEGAKKATHARL